MRNDDFLIVDKMITRRQRVLLFASSEQLKMLFKADSILMDGTFSTCPKMFDQVTTDAKVLAQMSSSTAKQRYMLRSYFFFYLIDQTELCIIIYCFLYF